MQGLSSGFMWAGVEEACDTHKPHSLESLTALQTFCSDMYMHI